MIAAGEHPEAILALSAGIFPGWPIAREWAPGFPREILIAPAGQTPIMIGTMTWRGGDAIIAGHRVLERAGPAHQSRNLLPINTLIGDLRLLSRALRALA